MCPLNAVQLAELERTVPKATLLHDWDECKALFIRTVEKVTELLYNDQA
jgi:hypothetical protein